MVHAFLGVLLLHTEGYPIRLSHVGVGKMMGGKRPRKDWNMAFITQVRTDLSQDLLVFR